MSTGTVAGVPVSSGCSARSTAWDGDGDRDRAEGAAAPRRAGPADRRPRPGRPGRPARSTTSGTSRPPGAVGAVRTFVAALRRALEPDRPPRTPARAAGHRGPGLRAARRAGRGGRLAVRGGGAGRRARCRRQTRSPGWTRRWAGGAARPTPTSPTSRGPAPSAPAWPSCGCTPSSAGREARLDARSGRRGGAGPRRARRPSTPGARTRWRLLALALYRTGRQGDALAVLRRARDAAGRAARRRSRARRCGAWRPTSCARPTTSPGEPAAADRGGPRAGRDGRRRLRPHASPPGARRAAGVDRRPAARPRGDRRRRPARRRAGTGSAAVAAAEELGDPELTARVIGAYDVPAIWTRVDDPEQAAQVVAAAERTLAALAARARTRRRGPGCWPRSRSSRAARAHRARAARPPGEAEADRPPPRRPGAAGLRPQRRLHADASTGPAWRRAATRSAPS